MARALTYKLTYYISSNILVYKINSLLTSSNILVQLLNNCNYVVKCQKPFLFTPTVVFKIMLKFPSFGLKP